MKSLENDDTFNHVIMYYVSTRLNSFVVDWSSDCN